jgi:hypothetical protein
VCEEPHDGLQQSQYRVAYPAVPLVGGVQGGAAPLDDDPLEELPASLAPPELELLPPPPELPELEPLAAFPASPDPSPDLPASLGLGPPAELAAPLDPLESPPMLVAPPEPPELDEAPGSVPVDTPVLELLLDPPSGFEPLDEAPVEFGLSVPDMLGLDDPPPHEAAMIDPVARAVIERTLRFMIKPLLRKILEIRCRRRSAFVEQFVVSGEWGRTS